MGKIFIELTGAFKKDYTEEEKQTYKSIYSEESEWPGAGEYSEAPMCIDVDSIMTFNPHTDEDKTTIEIVSGQRFAVAITYDELKDLLKSYHQIL